ncbi:nucleolus protein required for cell viability [Eremomyces bilateralis CBS 781.70]|uniref:U3 small nucleolar RNA-associated protein 25 n=1 Tax=Eremomyces bilateralis CBS 781.70 TaxID=1392243 RepID=A0A6G1G8R7_9PEZI|nr:nucleolus protein required for cell viability [Eremomyces bilateralis CBS 781.70]KAF1814495.1 nucleolus protein required for cell viability [Eremomyces bilateralis CBS 781.70]
MAVKPSFKRGRPNPRAKKQGRTFTSTRLQDETKDLDIPEETHTEDDTPDDASHDASDSDLDASEPPVRPYNSLLLSLQHAQPPNADRRKRRRLNRGDAERGESPALSDREIAVDGLQPDEEVLEEVESADHDEPSELDDIDQDEPDSTSQSDPFHYHLGDRDEERLQNRISALKDNSIVSSSAKPRSGGSVQVLRPTTTGSSGDLKLPTSTLDPDALAIKSRFQESAQKVLKKAGDLDKDLAEHIFTYRDTMFASRTVKNAARIRKLTCLHMINHIFKTRDQVLKNNARLSKLGDGDVPDIRDQGFTRPKVLILLETRDMCAKYMDAFVEICGPDQQENKSRFQDSFVDTEPKFSSDRPEDFRELFEGNGDNDFKLGIKFTRKTMKFFAQFYQSDLILASPLGLRRTIESKGSKKAEYDFLSSIEVVVVDQADAMLMQNWEHVDFVFDHLNLQPKDAHGCDFTRVRSWYLDGNASFLRQTIVFSAFMTPELNNIFAKRMRNIEGKAKFLPEHLGVMQSSVVRVKQTFSRFDSAKPANDPDERFEYFKSAVLPALVRLPRPAEGGQGVLLFVPSYMDFVRLRNHFATSTSTESLSFGVISEYTDMPNARRARSHFISGKYSVLLYTGRAHHFRRNNIQGVKRIIMYGIPENPIFYQEFVDGYLGRSINEGLVDAAETHVRTLFSRWDMLKLERVVGAQRAKKMVMDNTGDTFDFL